MMATINAISRRSFLGGAALGAATKGFGLTDVMKSGARRPAPRTNGEETPVLQLDRNESSYGLPPAAVRAIEGAIGMQSPRYPGEETIELTETLAKRFGVGKDQILIGCGSTEILKVATETFCSPSGAAVVAEPTFEAVATYSPLAHARAVRIPVTKDYKHDLPRMLEAAAAVGGFIFFCNPSNPTGTIVDKQEVDRIVRRIPHGVVMLIDEAYFDYAQDPGYESCLRYVKEGLPVVVSRTFSKIYGMAGLRLGYALGHRDLIQWMSERRLASNANQMATAAASAALREDEFISRIRNLNSRVRDYLCAEVRALGLDFIPSQTNFVMIHLGRPAQPVIDALKERKVLVGRLFPSMPNHMRVTLGTGEEMKVFVREFKEVLNRNR
jgi:histidinol-phosphate aminotransferase